jgi:hypothetical protein
MSVQRRLTSRRQCRVFLKRRLSVSRRRFRFFGRPLRAAKRGEYGVFGRYRQRSTLTCR